MSMAGALWLPPVLVLPALLALAVFLPGLRERALALLPFAALPGLAAALLAPEGTALQAPAVLLGSRLELAGNGRIFLGFAAGLWAAAGCHAWAAMRGDAGTVRFAALWCLTLTGSLGVFLAADVVTFYAAFTCVSLAAYPLVVHAGTRSAMHAGRVYIVLALAGEACLLLGFMLAASAATSLAIDDVRAALGMPGQGAALALLLTGFAIKAGVVPLHVWLPLAHPAAPTPASAVLSGAIVKAGVFGLMQFLPAGAAPPGWEGALLAAGLVTAWYGILAGLAQSSPKAILAYSTVSQMGLVTALLATVLSAGPTDAVLAAATLYALHHGLAKGALFMGVGVVAASGARAARPVLAVLALPALSLAGLPLSSGALAKLGAKPSLGGGMAELLFVLSAVGTALLMLRFMVKVGEQAHASAHARPRPRVVLPWLALVIAGAVAPWMLFAGATGSSPGYPLSLANLWAGAWPLAVAGAAAVVAWRSRLRMPAVPEGDLLVPVLALARRTVAWAADLKRPALALPPARLRAATGRFDRWMARAESLLSRWSVAGTLLLVLMMLAVW